MYTYANISFHLPFTCPRRTCVVTAKRKSFMIPDHLGKIKEPARVVYRSLNVLLRKC